MIFPIDHRCKNLTGIRVKKGRQPDGIHCLSLIHIYNVAKSVGTNTYGKGVMQVTHSLKDGSAIRITIAQYNPPKSANYDGEMPL